MKLAARLLVILSSISTTPPLHAFFEDGFEQPPVDPEAVTVEFESDSLLLFSAPGERREIRVVARDVYGQPLIDQAFSWESSSPAMAGFVSGEGAAVEVQVNSGFNRPIKLVATHTATGKSASAIAVWTVPSPQTVLIPSSWVLSVAGDRSGSHQIRFIRNSTTESLTPGGYVVSGDEAGIMSEVLHVNIAVDGVLVTAVPVAVNQAFESVSFEEQSEPLLITAKRVGSQEVVEFRGPDGKLIERQTTEAKTGVTCEVAVGQQVELDLSVVEAFREISFTSTLKVAGYRVEEFSVGAEGEAGFRLGLTAEAQVETQAEIGCSYAFQDIRLPGLRASIFLLTPVWKPVVSSTMTGTFGGAAQLLLPTIERSFRADGRVRYLDMGGWGSEASASYVESDAGSLSFELDGALEASITPSVLLGTDLSVSVGRANTPLFFEIVRVPLLSFQAGVSFGFSKELPLDSSRNSYGNPDVRAEVELSGQIKLDKKLIQGGISSWIPISLENDIVVPLFDYSSLLHQTQPVSGSLSCIPTCTNIQYGAGTTLNGAVSHPGISSGSLELLLRRNGETELLPWLDLPYLSPETDFQVTNLSELLPGSYGVYARLRLDGSRNTYTQAFPLSTADAQPIGTFSIDAIVDEPFLSNVADGSLRECLRSFVGQQVGMVRDLSCNFQSVATLAGLDLFFGLESLTVVGGSVRDLSPLSGLSNLYFLNINENAVESLDPLTGLTKLRSLYVSDNPITSLNALATLPQLQNVGADRTLVSALPSLGELEHLDTLTMFNSALSDISGVEGSQSLRIFHISGNSVGDISPLEGLSSLRSLQLVGNPIADLNPLYGLTSLSFLSVTHESCTQIANLLSALPGTEISGSCTCSCSCGDRINFFHGSSTPFQSCSSLCSASCPAKISSSIGAAWVSAGRATNQADTVGPTVIAKSNPF